jgi:glycosyltransferase involved in cell wall biosynthesis
VGRLERYKGHQRIISAMPAILAQRPDVRLRIAGEGPYEPDLRRLAARLGVAERVEIRALPIHDRSGMAGLMAGAALVAVLSLHFAR